jgi:hypothetical protein
MFGMQNRSAVRCTDISHQKGNRQMPKGKEKRKPIPNGNSQLNAKVSQI